MKKLNKIEHVIAAKCFVKFDGNSIILKYQFKYCNIGKVKNKLNEIFDTIVWICSNRGGKDG